jgi:predicted patatin/cPLA2 family phospholipase
VPNQHCKTALILSSGAMRGAYQCGVLKAFKEYDLQFDVVIGSSAGAYNGIRYLSNQMDICEEIYIGEKLQSCIDIGYSDGLEFIRNGQII